MTLPHRPRTTRQKAVWGPKRAVAALALLGLALSGSEAAAAPKTGNGKPQQVTKAKPGLPNHFVKDYKLDSHLTERASKGNARETVDVIVTLNPGQTLNPSLKRYLCPGYSSLDIINAYSLCGVPTNTLTALSNMYGVHRMNHNRPAKETDLLSSTAVHAETLAQQYGYNGQGVTVAFIDSGLSASQLPDLSDKRVVKFVDFVTPFNLQRVDLQGHGTHVTGVVAGTGADDARYGGIAPGTKVISLRVLDENGVGSIANIIAALDWVSKNATKYNIRIVNMSVGAGVYESFWTDPLTLAAKALVDKNITVVAAAGNRGKNSKGELQWGGITAPGTAPWVLTTCAFRTMGTLDTSDDVVASFSSSGPTAVDFTAKPDICAPGVGIVSLAAPEGHLYQLGLQATPQFVLGNSGSGYAPYMSLSGTSQATPFVTGTVALMLQANPNLTPNLIKGILQYTANFKNGVSALRQGAGFMNTMGAVTLASFYAHATSGSTLPVDDSWSRHIIWGNHMLSGGVLDPSGNAWLPGVEWGWAKSQGDDGDNIVWGTDCGGDDCDNIVWGTSDDGDNIVWGTSDDDDNIVWGTSDDDDNIVWGTSDDDDNIVWGTSDDDDNIVWGTDCGGDDCDNIVWGSSDDDDNIVWGTSDDDDNIVWGTSDDDDNIVWGTSDDDDNIVWGTSLVENVVWGATKNVKQVVPPPALKSNSKKGGK